MVRTTLLQLLRSSRKQFTTTSYLTGFDTSRVVRWELTAQQRWASQSPSPTTEEDKKETCPTVVYNCPYSSGIKNLKHRSLAWCVFGFSAPVITTTLMTSPPNMTLMLSASSVIFDSVVYKIRWRPGSDSFEVVKLTPWLGLPTSPKTVLFCDVRVANKPELSKVLGFRVNERYYVVYWSGFRDKAFLKRITSAPAATY